MPASEDHSLKEGKGKTKQNKLFTGFCILLVESLSYKVLTSLFLVCTLTGCECVYMETRVSAPAGKSQGWW